VQEGVSLESSESLKAKAVMKSKRSVVRERMSHDESREKAIALRVWELSEQFAVENATVARVCEMGSGGDHLNVPMTRIVSDRPSCGIEPSER
jgi:hypothetical protein